VGTATQTTRPPERHDGDTAVLRSLSLRRRIYRMTSLAVVVLGVLLTFVATGLVVASVVGINAVNERTQEEQSRALYDDLLQERLALAQYAAGGGADLDAYLRHRRSAEQEMDLLVRDAGGTRRAPQAAQAAAAVTAWQNWAAGVQRAVQADRTLAVSIAAADQGSRLFDAVSTTVGALTADLQGDTQAADRALQASAEFSATSLVAGTVLVLVVVLRIARRVRTVCIDPLERLAATAQQIAGGRNVPIPEMERTDEVGVLARALQGWLDASAEREVLLDQAPVGICRVDGERRMTQVNDTMAAMLGYTKDELTGVTILDINPPEDRHRTIAAHEAFMAGKQDLYVSERRWLRKNGSLIWCLLRVAPVRPGVGRPPVSLIAIAEDVTQQRHQSERAAAIQRGLLPRETPVLPGYDLAGACRPAQDVAGDLYDWVIRSDGTLDLTVADVMGKGVPAALVMATVRAALRAAAASLGPAERVKVAADSLALGIADEGVFVTLFHCRLDVGSGVFRYVDAGHGYCAIRRADGAYVHLKGSSLPLGVDDGAEPQERTGRIEPGDALVLYSDGLVETEERTGELTEFAPEITEPPDAAGAVARVLARMPEHPHDDVTLLILRRRHREPLAPTRAAARGADSRSAPGW
jgi:PAS domain S-box-containing protein